MKKVLITFAAIIAVSSFTNLFAAHDYREALYLSTYYYGAQRCGDTQSWIHGACHVKDGQTVSRDLTGGWHDCGDHVLFGQTAPYAASVLLHSYVEFQPSHEDRYTQANSAPPANGIPDILDEAKIMTDWLIKAHIGTGFYYQKGNGDYDHKHMSEPVYYGNTYNVTEGGEKDGGRPVSFASSGASNIAGNSAAALALMAIAYAPYDSAYADTCYTKAKAYLATGETSPNAVGGGGYYPAGNWGDDMAWGAIAIRKAALARGNSSDASTYLTKAQGFTGNSYTMPTNWIFCYDHTEPIVAYELYKAGDTSQLAKLKTEVDSYRASMVTCGTGSYAFKTEWGSLRYAANMAYIAALYGNIATGTEKTNAVTFLKNNIDFILGTHGDIAGSPGAQAGRSFLIGYTNPDNTAAGSVQHPHHRAAFGRTTDADTKWPQENASPGSVPYLYQLKGALVGGPRSSCGNYNDKIDDYVANEVGVDYNAGFVGSVAAYIAISNPATPTYTYTPSKTNTPDPAWTKTFTYTATATATITPIPPPTNKLNLEVKAQGSSASCTGQTFGFNYKITNWETTAVNTSNLTVVIWLDTTGTIAGSIYNARKYNSAGTDQGTITASISSAAGEGCAGGTKKAIISITATDIPENGGYLTIEGALNRDGYQTPFDPECNDYAQIESTWTSYRNESTHALYQGTDLVCEYLDASTRDTATARHVCTGATGCPGATTSTPTNTRTNTSTPTATSTHTSTNTYTNTRTNTPTASNTRTNTATNTPIPPTATFTNTASNTFTKTYTVTNTPIPPTATFTYTASNTRTNTSTSTNTPIPPTSTHTNTFTITNTATNTFTNTHTITNTPSDTFTNTHTITNTPSDTPTNTHTITKTFTNTHTNTFTATDTFTNTFTRTFTQTNTFTDTATETNTFTPTATPIPGGPDLVILSAYITVQNPVSCIIGAGTQAQGILVTYRNQGSDPAAGFVIDVDGNTVAAA
ncbi:MAG TPA: glycoside hydrolase family 9 protein, partial [Candidatus Goldiibacteriota bacterium]|nr:glycoside hydrolase family 9 protein [Candidatus Goldiibacteriota bacterium]